MAKSLGQSGIISVSLGGYGLDSARFEEIFGELAAGSESRDRTQIGQKNGRAMASGSLHPVGGITQGLKRFRQTPWWQETLRGQYPQRGQYGHRNFIDVREFACPRQGLFALGQIVIAMLADGFDCPNKLSMRERREYPALAFD